MRRLILRSWETNSFVSVKDVHKNNVVSKLPDCRVGKKLQNPGTSFLPLFHTGQCLRWFAGGNGSLPLDTT